MNPLLRYFTAAMVCVMFAPVSPVAAQSDKQFDAARREMVEIAVKGAGVKNQRVLDAMLKTPRHEFVPRKLIGQAYLDAGLPIGEGQTISSPFIVAYMTESLDPQPTDKVLEIGTGSGYQAAVLSPLVDKVYTIEIVEELGRNAKKILKRLDYDNVEAKIGDGYKGWPEHAPFDKIIVTCSPERIPKPLFDQLREGGMIVVPVGERHQQTLYLMRKTNGELVAEALRPTLFVPMTGAAEDIRQVQPDAANPKLLNGDFEEELDEQGFAPGWYYQRQMSQLSDLLSPSGEYYVQFENEQTGKPSHLLQGFAVDGREVPAIKLSASFKCENVIAGFHPEDLPAISITFYGENRATVGKGFIGPFQGSRAWRNYDHVVEVPKDAREAILRIGLFGATGSASFDNVIVRKLER